MENGAALLLVSHDKDVLGQFEEVHDLSEINKASAWQSAQRRLEHEPVADRSAKPKAASAVDCDHGILHRPGQWAADECVVVKDQAERKFMGVDSGFDAVVGPPGSKLPLVLNAIFHLESSERNLSWEQYEAVAAHPKVRTAVPLALGDNYYGYRLVGVTTNFFGVEYRDGEKYDVQDGGYVFRPDKKQAVVGSFVAERLGLKVGDKFHPYHGLTFDESEKHAEIYIVTGIMKPTNTPGDRVIWIPIKGLQNMEGHKAESSTRGQCGVG